MGVSGDHKLSKWVNYPFNNYSKINVTILNNQPYLPYTLIYLIIKFLFLLAVKREPCLWELLQTGKAIILLF